MVGAPTFLRDLAPASRRCPRTDVSELPALLVRRRRRRSRAGHRSRRAASAASRSASTARPSSRPSPPPARTTRPPAASTARAARSAPPRSAWSATTSADVAVGRRGRDPGARPRVLPRLSRRRADGRRVHRRRLVPHRRSRHRRRGRVSSASPGARRTSSSARARTSARARSRSCSATHPAVAEVAVVGLPDAVAGEIACAVLRLRAGAAAPSLDEIAHHLLAQRPVEAQAARARSSSSTTCRDRERQDAQARAARPARRARRAVDLAASRGRPPDRRPRRPSSRRRA